MKLARGSGNITIDGAKRTFSFTAEGLPNGTVRGEAEIHRRDLEISSVHLRIDCLQVVWNMAFLSGAVTRSSDPDLEGTRALFWVQDNGEGANDPADRISLCVICDFAFDCKTVAPFGPPPDELVFPVEGGNIQVQAV